MAVSRVIDIDTDASPSAMSVSEEVGEQVVYTRMSAEFERGSAWNTNETV